MLVRIVRLAALLTALSGASAAAADALEPVKTVMRVAGWTDGITAGTSVNGYFDESLLASIYSASFADVYRLAQRTDELQDGSGYMLGYDVVIGGQDSCSLKDVRFEARPLQDTVTAVDVYFDATSCFGHKPDLSRPQTVYHVVEENGRFVIDNIWNDDYRDGAVDSSVKAQFAAMVNGYLQFRLTGSWPKE